MTCTGTGTYKCVTCAPATYSFRLGMCALCPSTCLQCYDDFSCLTCINVAGIVLKDYVCACPLGTFLNLGTQSCDPCDSSCRSCRGTATFCLSCPPTKLMNSNTCSCGQYQYLAADGTCQNCHSSCGSCTGPLATNCVLCNTGTAASVDHTCLAVACTSKKKNLINTCTPCDATCLTCTCSTMDCCKTCKTGATLTNSGYCFCAYNQVMSGLGDCLACHPTCYTCSGVGANSCTACTSGVAPVNGACPVKPVCASNQYVDSTNTCQNCSPECGTC